MTGIQDATLETTRGQLAASQAENETMQERVANIEAMVRNGRMHKEGLHNII